MNRPVNALFVRVDTAELVQNSHCWNSAETGIRGVGKTSRETANYSAAVKSNDRNQPLSLQVGVSKGNENEQHALSALCSTRSRCCSPLPRAFPVKIWFLDNGTCLPLRAAPPPAERQDQKFESERSNLILQSLSMKSWSDITVLAETLGANNSKNQGQFTSPLPVNREFLPYSSVSSQQIVTFR